MAGISKLHHSTPLPPVSLKAPPGHSVHRWFSNDWIVSVGVTLAIFRYRRGVLEQTRHLYPLRRTLVGDLNGCSLPIQYNNFIRLLRFGSLHFLTVV